MDRGGALAISQLLLYRHFPNRSGADIKRVLYTPNVIPHYTKCDGDIPKFKSR